MGQMSGLPYAAARERASDVLRHVGLAEERYRPMGGYSTGMKQRAKLAQALVHDPRLVLLDEPTNGLDPSSRDDMLALVQRIGQRVRDRGARHLPPARRAGAGQRPRRRARRRAAAAVLGDHRLPARDRQPDRRGPGPSRRRPAARPGAGRGRAGRPARRRHPDRGRRPRRDHPGRRPRPHRRPRPRAWCGCRSATTASRTSSAREVPAVSSPSETADRPPPAGVIHDLGYRPYTRARGSARDRSRGRSS